MHPTYATKCAYVGLNSGRVYAPACRSTSEAKRARVNAEAGTPAGGEVGPLDSEIACAPWLWGLTLVHFSALPEPFLTQNTPYLAPNTPKHPLNTP